MAFHDVRLPEDVERGALGGPGFKTTIIQLSSGFEQRNIDWENSRGSWDIGYGIQTKTAFSTVLDFFYARRAKGHSYRFKDWTDFQISTEQSIGTGDNLDTTFQIFKRYTSGGINFDRTISKPVSGVRAFLNSVEQSDPADFSVNLLTGIITFVSAPGVGVDIGVICDFDVPVRFDTDRLPINLETFNAGAVPQIPIVEVRGE